MIYVNSSLMEQIVSLLEEHGFKPKTSEAPGHGSCVWFYGEARDADEQRARKLITDHFGDGALLGASYA